MVGVFVVMDENGVCSKVEKRMAPAPRGRGQRRGLALYYLESGEMVNRIGTDAFVVVATGLRWQRVKD